ncbi:hypothetical protein [Succinimonas sp.]|uniref:hypothetical protein n=1 Tax=Succinimonas sp. TaxID=1936151 RepID=UPI00386A6AC8
MITMSLLRRRPRYAGMSAALKGRQKIKNKFKADKNQFEGHFTVIKNISQYPARPEGLGMPQIKDYKEE